MARMFSVPDDVLYTVVEGEDITEEVQTLYDIVVNSMDWGSGFLSADEMEAAIAIGRELDLELPSNWEAQVKAQREHEEYWRKLANDEEFAKAEAIKERERLLDIYVDEGKMSKEQRENWREILP